MSFDNDTNRKRVKKMSDTLLMLVKSAKSNKASRDDLTSLLAPFVANLDRVVPRTTMPSDAYDTGHKPAPTSGNAPQWSSVLDMAREADLKDLTGALSVYLNRIDEYLEAKK